MKNINIKAVTQLTGINENTLRAWERRHTVLAVLRDNDGRRIYSIKDIEKLRLLWSLVQKGHLIGNIAPHSVMQLKAIDEQKGPTDVSVKTAVSLSNKSEQNHIEEIIDALKSWNLAQIHSSLQSTRFELSPRKIITNFVLPLMQEIGKLVSESKLRISQEHLLSSVLRDYLGQLYQSLSLNENLPSHKMRIVAVTTREGDLHEFGILLAAILFRINGHLVYYLGPSMPVKDLADTCEDFKIDTLVVGLASLPKKNEVISANNFLRKLDKESPKKINIFCGGNVDIKPDIIKSGRQFIRFSSLMDLDQFLQKTV